jgi:hypothetical protein
MYHNHHLNKGNEIRKIRPEKQKKQLKTMLSQLYYLPCLITIYGSKKPLQIHDMHRLHIHAYMILDIYLLFDTFSFHNTDVFVLI